MFHHLDKELIKGVEIPKLFTNPFDYQPHPLVEIARKSLCDYLESQSQWLDELDQGKMLGLLIVEREGSIGFLAAFSGYLDGKTTIPYFVAPICDLLEPNGFFATEERAISAINKQLEKLELCEPLRAARQAISTIKEEERAEIEPLKAQYKQSRKARRTRRAEGCEPHELEAMNLESQRQKGDIRRREILYRNRLAPHTATIERIEAQIKELNDCRQGRSAALQTLTFSRFEPLNASGQQQNLISIFRHYNNSTPPAGSGECAAPKLLHYAFANGLRPIAMGEFWWGTASTSQVRRHLSYYPACRGKCHPILTYMLQGMALEEPSTPPHEPSLADKLKVLYEDDDIVAFDKPSGLASVRGVNHSISVQSIAEERYPLSTNNLVVHRLDRDTSGVIIMAKSGSAQKALQEQFANHTIRKRYVALLDGLLEPNSCGSIELPLILDPTDRPRQMVDYQYGKAAYTHYRVVEIVAGQSRVVFYPQTGRTHQLRVHSAHPKGLNMPIVGDRLYGTAGERMMLHAEQITIIHPSSGRKMTIAAEVRF